MQDKNWKLTIWWCTDSFASFWWRCIQGHPRDMYIYWSVRYCCVSSGTSYILRTSKYVFIASDNGQRAFTSLSLDLSPAHGPLLLPPLVYCCTPASIAPSACFVAAKQRGNGPPNIDGVVRTYYSRARKFVVAVCFTG